MHYGILGSLPKSLVKIICLLTLGFYIGGICNKLWCWNKEFIFLKLQQQITVFVILGAFFLSLSGDIKSIKMR